MIAKERGYADEIKYFEKQLKNLHENIGCVQLKREQLMAQMKSLRGDGLRQPLQTKLPGVG
jgi:hypothetical protein